jgi:hypothetical protein
MPLRACCPQTAPGVGVGVGWRRAQFPELSWAPFKVVAGIAVAVGGLLLVIVTQWDSLGGGTSGAGWQDETRTCAGCPAGWLPCVRHLVR